MLKVEEKVTGFWQNYNLENLSHMWVDMGVFGFLWVVGGVLNQAHCRQRSGRVVLNFWFILWVHVGTLNTMAK